MLLRISVHFIDRIERMFREQAYDLECSVDGSQHGGPHKLPSSVVCHGSGMFLDVSHELEDVLEPSLSTLDRCAARSIMHSVSGSHSR
jgi:hypothetical protein